jgi:nitroreductase
MDFYEVIEKRRSIRLLKAPATEEQLKRIILAGTKAPSGINLQNWEFIVVNDPRIIDQIINIKWKLQLTNPAGKDQGIEYHPPFETADMEARLKKSFKNASVICQTSDRRHWAAIGSVWLCIENMYLAAVAEGLGAWFCSFWAGYTKQVEKLLGLPKTHTLVNVMVCGVPAEEPAPKEMRPVGSWLHINRYGNKE